MRTAEMNGPSSSPASLPRLSICVATYRRGHLIAETLDSIVGQLDGRCELVILDGASPDETEQIVRPYAQRHANVRYIREETNSGVDRDYDKAVLHATGDYCWLMTDDDLLVSGAIARVLAAVDDDPDVVVVNAQVRSADFSSELKPCLLKLHGKSTFDGSETDQLFAEMGAYLSFIGSVVIRREVWLARLREPYFETCFIHIGVIFQRPLAGTTRIVREPLIVVRYGNAMWTSRGFEIWMFKWPALVWSFKHISAAARSAVSPRTPYRSPTRLMWYRAIGGYSINEYQRFLVQRDAWPLRIASRWIAALPERVANAGCGIYCWLRAPSAGRMALYEMSRARGAATLTKALARVRQLS